MPWKAIVPVMRRPAGASSRRARSRSSGVSTPNGPCSMRAQPIRMPASSARSCSRFSRRSSGDGRQRDDSGQAPRADRHRCRHDASAARRPTGSAAARNTAPARRSAASANAQAALTNDAVLASVSEAIGTTSVPMSQRRVGERRHRQPQLRGRDGREVALQVDHHVVPPLGIEFRQRGDARDRSPTAAPDRSAPRVPPAARTASAISGSPQATATGPMSASRPRSSMCTIIGRPWMSASGLPGSRVEAMRAGMTTIGFTG